MSEIDARLIVQPHDPQMSMAMRQRFATLLDWRTSGEIENGSMESTIGACWRSIASRVAAKRTDESIA